MQLKVQLIILQALITINSLSVLSVENIRGGTSTKIELRVQHLQMMLFLVRDQILEIDTFLIHLSR